MKGDYGFGTVLNNTYHGFGAPNFKIRNSNSKFEIRSLKIQNLKSRSTFELSKYTIRNLNSTRSEFEVQKSKLELYLIFELNPSTETGNLNFSDL